MQDILVIFQTVKPETWNGLFILLTSGTAVAVTLQIIKHFGKLHEAKKTVMFLLGFLATIASFADWAIQYSYLNPKAAVIGQLGWIVTAAVFIHRFAVSPAYKRVVGFLEGIYADAEAYRKENALNPTPVTSPDVVAAAVAREFTLEQ